MLDDLTKEIKAQLYERVKSPLFGAFALSWVAWNYRPLLAVTSGMTFQEKLAYLDSLYPSTLSWLTCSLGAPLLTAVLFLLAYPYPARWIYRYWANQHKELKKVQQEIEDETPMTQEEAKALRKTSLAQIAEVQAQMRDMSQMNRELNERLKEAAEENLRLATERGQYQTALQKSEEELRPHLERIIQKDTLNDSRPVIEPRKSTKFIQLESLSTDVREQLFRLVGSKESVQRVFLSFVTLDGRASVEEVAAVTDSSQIDAQYGLDELKTKGLVVRGGDKWALTSDGRALAVRLNLTALVRGQ